MIDFLIHNAPTFSYLVGAAWILGFAALALFFTVGGVFGPINDAISVFQFLFLVPVALALHRILAAYMPLPSWGATAVGIAAMIVIAVLQALLVVKVVRFERTLRPILTLSGLVGLWWRVTSFGSLIHGTLPTGLAWVGVVAGVGSLVGLVGFWIGGQKHPLAAAGMLALAVAVPVWSFWLGRVLATR